ncbi:MAG: beta-ketoacyl synthase [Gammaproteobacteria bacterium]|nr:beta-ketoacyl synthase [Gammaproteobacteria bacterium]
MSDQKKSKFEAIAIVGRGCVLPGCHCVDDLWNIVESGRVEISSASQDNWHVNQERLLSDKAGVYQLDKMWSNHGGYIRNFSEHFDPSQIQLDQSLLDTLDPVFLWSLEAARQAMSELKSTSDLSNAGVVLGNLSYPTRSHSRFAEEVWLREMRGEGQLTTAAENRFMSGLPAKLVAEGMGFGGSTLALDAACASGLYAIKIACDRLQSGRADIMLAGAVNAADPLFIHMGFCALKALSKSGKSQPFSQMADGLVPSEGAAFVTLKRLKDARATGDKVYGIIRGIGLSNDGRSGGFLSPSTQGQVACIKQAYNVSGVDPADVQFVECHATGTEAGDSTEIESLSNIFPHAKGLPLGSLKGNLGHLITVSGVAGLLKILLAFEHKTIPGTPNATPNLTSVGDNGFEVPNNNQKWQSNGPRLAAISSFGFGGNNAHLVVQQDDNNLACVAEDTTTPKFAVVSMAIRTNKDTNADEFGHRICTTDDEQTHTNKPDSSKTNHVALTAKSLAFPPNDLKEALGQQLVLLDLLPDLEKSIEHTAKDRIGIFIGMQTDSEVCRYGLRWRLQDLEPGFSKINLDEEIASSPNAASVIGKMPNVPANRLSNQLNILGPGFTVSREELSGDGALELALSAIQKNELDAVIVGAVELGIERVHQQAISQILSTQVDPADAAIMMVIKSLPQARADNDEILALIKPAHTCATDSSAHETPMLNQGAYAAAGLLNIGAGIQRLRGGQSNPNSANGIEQQTLIVTNQSMFGEHTSWELQSTPSSAKAFAGNDHPLMEIYAAHDKEQLINNLLQGRCGEEGNCRVALVGQSAEFERLRQRAIQGIRTNVSVSHWSLDGVSFSETAMGGEVASVFTGAASSYPGMGKNLFLGLPRIAIELAADMPTSSRAMSIAFNAKDKRHTQPAIQLAGSSYLCQLHAKISRNMLKITSHAAMGLSSGETNSMFAFGVWQDMDALRNDIDATDLYKTALAQDFSSVRNAWNLDQEAPIDWDNCIVLAPVDEVRKAIAEVEHAYLTIVQSDQDSVIGGERSAVQRVLNLLNNPNTIPLGHDLAVHCSVVQPFESIWRKLHTRKTTAPKGIRFYSSYFSGSYEINKTSVADALTGQALNTVEFPTVVKAAWDDGVRVFIEHGPRNSLTNAIDAILTDKPHLAVALDHTAVPAMTQLYRTVARLWCAGIDMDLSEILFHIQQPEAIAVPRIKFDLRLPAIRAQHTAHTHPVQTYQPPDLCAGPIDARHIPSAPALAYTLAPTSKQIKSGDGLTEPKPPSTPNNIEVAPFTPAPKLVRTRKSTQTTSMPSSEHQLLIEGHQRMLEAHQAFLTAQLQGQQAYEQTISRMQAGLFGVVSAIRPGVITPAAIIEPQPVTPAPLADQIIPAPLQAPMVAKVIDHTATPRQLPGPTFSRQQLEVLSKGKISSILGSLFEQQDDYDIQVRMPEPPLLLCDRVLGIEGQAGSMGTGTIWTETDVLADSWYLHHGRMPPGIFIECGQADLLLISWLGIDFHNKGDRAYRLLGCELVFHGELPQPGETLEYEIKVDGHAQQGDVRLFFFHYECHINGELRISVHNGQAGFFSKQELADSAGVLWDAGTANYSQLDTTVEAAAVCHKTAFSREDIAAYLRGDLQRCFGDEFARAHTHTRTPRSAQGQCNFLGEVTHFEPEGGPAGRGYLRIVEDIHHDNWFFAGHFNNDPCMPGTLMADACLQAMAFYMSARGHTLHKDGWRFQPVRNTNYKFVCRGQALPESKQLVYEVFIDEEVVDEQPSLFAHVLCTIDGRKAFLCERLGLQLIPDWPLSSQPELLKIAPDDRPLAYINNFPLDYRSLISCAWGKPSDAFGEGFAHYDGPVRSPRLPGPPYHFMTRILALKGDMASMQKGGCVEAIYDIPPDAWYFAENASRTMPFCVLMEIALQPCGWLASYTLGQDYANSDLLFRNLDGTAIQHREIIPGDGSLTTTAELISLSQIGDLIIENFEVVCSVGGEPVFTMKTVFGFFPPDAMANQKGLTIADEERLIFDQTSNNLINLEERPSVYFDHPSARLPNSKLLMIDRITYLSNTDGRHGHGGIRGEKDVDITEWFFKAHFFQDPVQPGSLGIEAMLQLMQAFMLSQGLHKRFVKPRFEPIVIGGETQWHYRGQITPDKSLITIDFQCSEQGIETDNTWILGDARLWGDGLKIYHAPKIGLRIIEDELNLSTSNNKLIAANWRGVRDYWVEQSAGEHLLVHDLGASLCIILIFWMPVSFSNAKASRQFILPTIRLGLSHFYFSA